MRSIMLALVMVLAIAACQSSTTSAETSAAKTVYEAKLAYQGLLIVAVRYNELPRCSRPTSPRVCSEQAVVDQLRRADTAAIAALDAAEGIVRLQGATKDMTDSAVATATNAVAAVRALTSSVRVQ